MRKEKSKRKGETIIGKIIYASLLFAPLFSILATTMYSILNENAYESYNDEYIEKLQNVDNTNLLANGNTYVLNYVQISNGSSYQEYSYYKIDVDWTDYGFENGTYVKFRLYANSYVTLYRQDDSQITLNNIWGKSLNTITIQLNSYMVTTQKLQNKDGNISITLKISEQRTLDNAFEYSINKVESNNLYNWAKSTGTYNVVLATCQGIGITNTFTPMLLTYWFMISIIYFIYDIGLILIMILHRKIHEFEDTVL